MTINFPHYEVRGKTENIVLSKELGGILEPQQTLGVVSGEGVGKQPL